MTEDRDQDRDKYVEETLRLTYGPPLKLRKGERVEHFVERGDYVLVAGRWQKVRDVFASGQGTGTLVTEYGATIPLDRPPPADFLYRKPSGVPVAQLAQEGVELSKRGVELSEEGLAVGKRGVELTEKGAFLSRRGVTLAWATTIIGVIGTIAAIVAAWASVKALK